ncbi:MAG: SprT family zinc-dependent metalloprotease [Rikenellaceae bacterium]
MQKMTKIIHEQLEISSDTFIDYDIEFSNRKSLVISVNKKDKKVVVKSPNNLSLPYIKNFVVSKSSWIKKQCDNAENNTSFVQLSYENGSKHYILGKEYILEIHSANITEIFTTDAGKLIINCRSNTNIELALKKWHATIAPRVFIEIMRPIIDNFGVKYKLYPSKLEYKFVKRYWGQCTPKRLIRINISLIHQPQAAIEYIILHELCHFIHQNHSKDFWTLVEKEMPDYKQRKALLTNYY